MLAVFIIDCGKHTILRQMSASGRLATFTSIVKRGVTVPLRSDADPLDGAVFQTLLTGTNPGRHGIHKYRQIIAGTYAYEQSQASKSPVPQVWQVLSQRGRRCCVFDPPTAFPFNGNRQTSWT